MWCVIVVFCCDKFENKAEYETEKFINLYYILK